MNVNRQRLTWGAAYALALAIAAGAFFVRDAAAQIVRVDTSPQHAIKFDESKDLVFKRRETLPFHANGMRCIADTQETRLAPAAQMIDGDS